VSVVENTALLLQRVLYIAGVGEDLVESLAGFADAGKCGGLTAAGYIYKDSQDYDDGQADKKDKKMFGHAACS
jgi:hypothetical protein